MRDQVHVDGEVRHITDLVNPPGMFVNGTRKQEWCFKNLLPMSGKLITEFDRRRNIRDMFSRKPSLLTSRSSAGFEEEGFEKTLAPLPLSTTTSNSEATTVPKKDLAAVTEAPPSESANLVRTAVSKRPQNAAAPMLATKRTKLTSQNALTNGSSKGQKSLNGFFLAKAGPSTGLDGARENLISVIEKETRSRSMSLATSNDTVLSSPPEQEPPSQPSPSRSIVSGTSDVIDPIVSKESWGKLFSKPAVPRCDHNEPCKTMLTKKKGTNCGRSFWMCARPLGPSGDKEKNSQWRCHTFIWASDWIPGIR